MQRIDGLLQIIPIIVGQNVVVIRQRIDDFGAFAKVGKKLGMDLYRFRYPPASELEGFTSVSLRV